MRILILFLIILFSLITLTSQTYISAVPIWLTSKFMRAGNEDVIKELTGEAIDPIYTFTFSSALPGIPNLAYGIRRYRGTFLYDFRYLFVFEFQVPTTWEYNNLKFEGSTWPRLLSLSKWTSLVRQISTSLTYLTLPSTLLSPIILIVSTMCPLVTGLNWPTSQTL